MMKHYLYVGLGNVGPRFVGTRHNIGIEVVRAWLREIEQNTQWQVTPWSEHSAILGMIARATHAEAGCIVHCLFPTTMMNDSGHAVAGFMTREKVRAADVLVIHDDVELALGDVVESFGGSAKGHNGVRSIQEELGTSDFGRLRLGIGRPPEGSVLSDFVLQKFLPEEMATVQDMTQQAITIMSAVNPS